MQFFFKEIRSLLGKKNSPYTNYIRNPYEYTVQINLGYSKFPLNYPPNLNIESSLVAMATLRNTSCWLGGRYQQVVGHRCQRKRDPVPASRQGLLIYDLFATLFHVLLPKTFHFSFSTISTPPSSVKDTMSIMIDAYPAIPQRFASSLCNNHASVVHHRFLTLFNAPSLLAWMIELFRVIALLK